MALLDRFAGAEHLDALASYRKTWDRWRAARTALDELVEAARDRERELDLLGYQVREIEAIGPEVDETGRLAAEEVRLAHVERLLELTTAVEDVLTGDGSLSDGMAAAAVGLDDAARLDAELAAIAARARGLSAEIAELGRDVRTYREGLLVDPSRLLEVRERVAALKGLQRKYGATDAEVLAFLGEAAARLAALETADDRLVELSSQVEELGAELSAKASVVTAGRRGVAPLLAEAIERELHELGMPGAMLEVLLEPVTELSGSGGERVELRLAPSTAQRPAPLAKTASGGELSRTMLACRSVMADLDQVPTLVFDEVDAGIGGEAGLAVGRRLARLAADRQVLVVTHLPQIACFADRHVFVDKRDGTASVRALDDDERVHELSRMLAGLTGSEGAVTHAEELLAAASVAKPPAR
jgi:DNA repair protein RecN (Recombination protein N)